MNLANIIYIVCLCRSEERRSSVDINRLDRLTSGLVLFAKSKAQSQCMEQLMRSRQLRKVYVARVRGLFPR